jgi:hypothetical protein
MSCSTWHVAVLASRLVVSILASLSLSYIVEASKKNTEPLISLGGATAVVRLKNKWPENGTFQNIVRSLAKLIG